MSLKSKDKDLKWKVDVPAMFKEVLSANNSMWIMKHPFLITDQILREGAKRAIELKDEQIISIFARLGMYEGLNDSKHPDHKRLQEIANKVFK